MGARELNLLNVTSTGEATLRAIARIKHSAQPVRHAVVSLTTISEIHVASILRALIESEKEGRTKLDAELLSRLEIQIFSTWRNLWEWLKEGFSVSIPAGHVLQGFQDCIELRNAIVHGNMSLTAQQDKDFLKSLKLRKRLERSLDVHFEGVEIRTGPETFERVVTIVRNFIVLFDTTVIAQHKETIWNLGENGAKFAQPAVD